VGELAEALGLHDPLDDAEGLALSPCEDPDLLADEFVGVLLGVAVPVREDVPAPDALGDDPRVAILAVGTLEIGHWILLG
jgi:hypothetical protein